MKTFNKIIFYIFLALVLNLIGYLISDSFTCGCVAGAAFVLICDIYNSLNKE